jgi:hypothetical protein
LYEPSDAFYSAEADTGSEDAGAELLELVEVLAAETRELVGPASGDPQVHDALIVRVAFSAYETGGHSPINQLGHAVVAQQQRVGDVTDRRTALLRAPSHREEELVLRRCQTLGSGLLLAPVQEPAQVGAEAEEVLVVVVGDPSIRHSDIDRTTIYSCFVGSPRVFPRSIATSSASSRGRSGSSS